MSKLGVFIVNLRRIDVDHNVLNGGKRLFHGVVSLVGDAVRNIERLCAVDRNFRLDKDARSKLARTEKIEIVDAGNRKNAVGDLAFKLVVAGDVDYLTTNAPENIERYLKDK